MAVSEPIKQSVGKAIGRIPSGVFILTTQHAGQSGAMMASWVQQASFEPPTISVAIAAGRPVADIIRASKRFALSVLGEGDAAIMKRYARGIPAGEDPFQDIKTQELPGGLQVLADSLAWMECRLLQTVTFNADHDLYLAEVTAGQLLREGHSFMHQRGNGFRY